VVCSVLARAGDAIAIEATRLIILRQAYYIRPARAKSELNKGRLGESNFRIEIFANISAAV
jgi:hypothetical protein